MGKKLEKKWHIETGGGNEDLCYAALVIEGDVVVAEKSVYGLNVTGEIEHISARRAIDAGIVKNPQDLFEDLDGNLHSEDYNIIEYLRGDIISALEHKYKMYEAVDKASIALNGINYEALFYAVSFTDPCRNYDRNLFAFDTEEAFIAWCEFVEPFTYKRISREAVEK